MRLEAEVVPTLLVVCSEVCVWWWCVRCVYGARFRCLFVVERLLVGFGRPTEEKNKGEGKELDWIGLDWFEFFWVVFWVGIALMKSFFNSGFF